MRDDVRRLAQAGPTFAAPLSDERADDLVAALPISPGHHVLDLGCGFGELLLRVLAAHPATTGTGVDPARAALDRAVRAAAERGLYERVEFVEADAASFAGRGDVVLCVASSDAFGGAAGALARLHDRVAPGGRVLFGDRFWATRPSPAARAAIGELPTRDEILDGATAAGFRIVDDDVSTLAEWDAFEAARRSGLERSGDVEAVAFAAKRRQEYEEGYRGALGFVWIVLAPDPPR